MRKRARNHKLKCLWEESIKDGYLDLLAYYSSYKNTKRYEPQGKRMN